MEMSERIKERRTLIGYTQEELGEKLGLQKSAIAKYENGRVENIKRSVIANMAKILDCSPSYLMGWDEEAPAVQNRGADLDADSDPIEALHPSERDHIQKYRELDPHGREMVDFTLLKEWERSTAEHKPERKVVPMMSKDDPRYVNAAHAIEGASEEDKQFDEDIMNDENF